jgi:hypothetical protein
MGLAQRVLVLRPGPVSWGGWVFGEGNVAPGGKDPPRSVEKPSPVRVMVWVVRLKGRAVTLGTAHPFLAHGNGERVHEAGLGSSDGRISGANLSASGLPPQNLSGQPSISVANP